MAIFVIPQTVLFKPVPSSGFYDSMSFYPLLPNLNEAEERKFF
jgi:hypothetical protein